MRRCIVLMAKPPQIGRVKTRLAPALGAEGACRLYACMLRDCIASLQQPQRWDLQLWGDGAADDPAWARAGIDCSDFSYCQQRGESLGERMRWALQSVLAQYQQVLIVGTDCPGVDCAYAEAAFAALSTASPLVIGPANDGGYVLLGMQQRCFDVFRDVEWSSERVLDQTRGLMRDLGVQWQELPVQTDIDTADDLSALPPHLQDCWLPSNDSPQHV